MTTPAAMNRALLAIALAAAATVLASCDSEQPASRLARTIVIQAL